MLLVTIDIVPHHVVLMLSHSKITLSNLIKKPHNVISKQGNIIPKPHNVILKPPNVITKPLNLIIKPHNVSLITKLHNLL